MTRSFPTFEWVPPSSNRRKAGIKHAAFCLLCGWWSISGWIITPAIIVNNLAGGIDVTKILLPQPPPLPGQPADNTAIEEYNRAAKRQQWTTVAVLFSMLLLVIIFFVLPSILRFGWLR